MPTVDYHDNSTNSAVVVYFGYDAVSGKKNDAQKDNNSSNINRNLFILSETI